MKTQKLKVTLNEVRRMQELAGISTLNEQINEGNSPESYYKTYTDAIDAAIKYAEKRGYTVDDEDVSSEISFSPKGRPKKDGEIKRAIIGLFKDNKPQKKALTIVVTYLDGMSKPYELVTYIN
jgi:hypothetical protein